MNFYSVTWRTKTMKAENQCLLNFLMITLSNNILYVKISYLPHWSIGKLKHFWREQKYVKNINAKASLCTWTTAMNNINYALNLFFLCSHSYRDVTNRIDMLLKALNTFALKKSKVVRRWDFLWICIFSFNCAKRWKNWCKALVAFLVSSTLLWTHELSAYKSNLIC